MNALDQTNDILKISRIHHALVNALATYAEKEESNDQNIAAHTFAAVIVLAYQINKDFAKCTLSDAVAMTEPIAVLIDEAIRYSNQEQSPSEQAVS